MEFFKYQGTGNDFVIIDNRDMSVNLSQKQVADICNRRFGIGADGLILLQDHKDYHFEMVYFNSDGNESSMCGNGGRCLIAFVKSLDIFESECTFRAIDGNHEGKIESGKVHLKMADITAIEKSPNFYFINTGSPHYVTFVDDVHQIDLKARARKVRYSDRFKDEGTNVNFVSKPNAEIRTYERGVEDETLSCGTGATACAIAMNLENQAKYENSCTLQTEGGELTVSYNRISEQQFSDIWLIGPAEFVFKGEVNV
ncbi:MAG: diaminopimelate epimerase [Flavobacteriales bacterium]|nr:diaminopimelate epimerase [Flavobacteriales bacterium]